MIFYLVTAKHQYTISPFVRSWSVPPATNIQIVPYAALPYNASCPAGTYIFSDLERLNEAQRSLVTQLWDQLAQAGDAVRLLNHPRRSLCRFDLLRTLYEQGLNRFNVFRATEAGQPWRFPVFVREENEHTGSLTPIINNAGELSQWLARLIMAGLDPSELLIVEFCDTKDEAGVYRKYSAYRVADRIFPRHVLFSRNWVVKDLDLHEPEQRAEIKAYCQANPHVQQLPAIFDSAGIDYGRIDYSLLDGAIQVWEINTNPIVLRPPDQYPEFSLPFHRAFAQLFTEVLHALDQRGPVATRIPISWSQALAAATTTTA